MFCSDLLPKNHELSSLFQLPSLPFQLEINFTAQGFFTCMGRWKPARPAVTACPTCPSTWSFASFRVGHATRWLEDVVKFGDIFILFWRPLINGLLVVTLQETNISHLGKRNIIFNSALVVGDGFVACVPSRYVHTFNNYCICKYIYIYI